MTPRLSAHFAVTPRFLPIARFPPVAAVALGAARVEVTLGAVVLKAMNRLGWKGALVSSACLVSGRASAGPPVSIGGVGEASGAPRRAAGEQPVAGVSLGRYYDQGA
jgi:hypothetical protein